MSKYDAVVVGGGWAGLAAATKLADEGASVILFEKNSDLGGRCTSFWDASFGEWLDNGAHAFISAYTTALGLIRKWHHGFPPRLESTPDMPWISKDGRVDKLSLSAGDDKLNLATGLMRFRAMSVIDRVKTLRAAEALFRLKEIDPENEKSVAEFLRGYGIKRGSCGGFWEALSIAVMNIPPEKAGIIPFSAAIQQGLFRKGEVAALQLPTIPFKQLYIDPARNYLTAGRVEIRLGQAVRSVIVDKSNRIAGVGSDDEDIDANAVVLAVPPGAVTRILPRRILKDSFFNGIKKFTTSPIATVHLSFDRPVTYNLYAFLPGAFTHWLFGRGKNEQGGWSRITAVISNSPSKKDLSLQDICARVLGDIRERLPEARTAEVKNLRGIRITDATIVLKPGTTRLRPSVRTPVSGLFIAGDWCDTGLPATIESAARSGISAGDLALEYIRT